MTEPTPKSAPAPAVKPVVPEDKEKKEKEKKEKRDKEREAFSKTVSEMATKHSELEKKFAKEDDEERQKKADEK